MTSTAGKGKAAPGQTVSLHRSPHVAAAKKDFELRNLLISVASRDSWFFYRAAPANGIDQGLLHGNDIKIYTMEMPGRRAMDTHLAVMERVS